MLMTSEGCAAEVTGVGYNSVGEVKAKYSQYNDPREVNDSIYSLLEVHKSYSHVSIGSMKMKD